MSFSHLKEMLDLNEADNLVNRFKDGWNDAKARHGARDAKLANANGTAGEVDDEPAGDATEPTTSTPTTPTAKPEASKQEKPEKFNPQDIKDDLTEYLDQFFTKFPNYGEGGAEDILQKHTSKEARTIAIDAFNGLAKRIDQLRIGFNTSLVKHGLVELAQAAKFNQQAKMMMGANAPSPPRSLIKFVKTESAFFKRLVKIDNNAQINDVDFKQMLALKVKKTDAARVPDAAQALNLLFGYMSSEFKAHAKVLETATAVGLDNERKQRIADRNK